MNVTCRRQEALHSFYRDLSAEPHTLPSTERSPYSDPEDPDPEAPGLDLAAPVPRYKARLTKTLETAGNDPVPSPSPISVALNSDVSCRPGFPQALVVPLCPKRILNPPGTPEAITKFQTARNDLAPDLSPISVTREK